MYSVYEILNVERFTSVKVTLIIIMMMMTYSAIESGDTETVVAAQVDYKWN